MSVLMTVLLVYCRVSVFGEITVKSTAACICPTVATDSLFCSYCIRWTRTSVSRRNDERVSVCLCGEVAFTRWRCCSARESRKVWDASVKWKNSYSRWSTLCILAL